MPKVSEGRAHQKREPRCRSAIGSNDCFQEGDKASDVGDRDSSAPGMIAVECAPSAKLEQRVTHRSMRLHDASLLQILEGALRAGSYEAVLLRLHHLFERRDRAIAADLADDAASL